MLNEGLVLLLAIGAKGASEEQDVGEERMAVRFLVQGLLVVGGEGPFAGEEEGAIVVGEVVVEFGAKTKINGRGGGEWVHVDGEEGGTFALPFDVDQATMRRVS